MLASVTHLIIEVTDVNDNPPKFVQSTYDVALSENNDVGVSVARVFATSRDIGVNAEISYSIIAGNSAGHFTIDATSGEVTLAHALDFERAQQLIVTIEARDGGEPPLRSSAILRINVTDYNDNAPRFTQERYEGSAAEDLPLGASVLQVLATDIDSAPNAMVTYYIVSGDPEHYFAIHQQSGVLSVNRKLDREQVRAAKTSLYTSFIPSMTLYL